MIIFTVLSTVFSFFVVYDKVNLRNPHHRSLIAKGTLAIVVEEVVDWFHPILYHETDPGTDLILAPAFALALLPVPPEVCGLDEAPIPGTDLIVAPVFALSTLPAPPEAPGPLSFLDSLDMLFSVVPYNHNSILPASLPQPSSTVTPSTHRTTLGFICLPALVILVSLLCLRFNGITKGHHTLYENAEYSESTGEVFVWSQSDVGCTVSAAPSLNAFQLIDRDVNLSSDITLGFQFSAEAENTVTDAEDVSSEVTPGSDGLNSTTTVTDNGDEDLSNATTPDSSDEEVNAATDAEDISSSCAFEQNNIDPLYSVTDMLLTTLIPSLNESLDAYVSCEEALAAKIASFLRMLLPEEDSTYDVPYWEKQSFVDAFREEMNQHLYPDPPLPQDL
ncbi:E3 ubiquitin-protein ligase [Termitomyces sp. T112]|nr:E3 ubiquitin-protein ligase [Termitomyces sp. T112]